MTELIDDVILAGAVRRSPSLEGYTVVRAETAADLEAYVRLRREIFVTEQGLFPGSDLDDVDEDPRRIVLLARSDDGEVLGGVRLHPAQPDGRDVGWWRGSRLAVKQDARQLLGVGAALVRAACAAAEQAGALRFDATVQSRNEGLFRRLGWIPRERVHLHDMTHVVMEWPVLRVGQLSGATKSPLGDLVGALVGQSTPGFRGDDGAPVPGSDLVAACDAILPSMVERDPEWAGWCAVLVNVNDLSAMGAEPVGLLDAIGARDASFARRIVRGLAEAAQAWGVPVLGGHTQLGVPAALSVTALGRTERPVPGGGGAPGDLLRISADLGGGWRPGYRGRQWDSSSHRTSAELRALSGVVPSLAPTAAKDVSMAGVVGTAGMLAEASGCRAIIDVGAVPTPPTASTADWLTCFPGFAMLTAEAPGRTEPELPGFLSSAVCGELVPGTGVGLRWPDGTVTDAIDHTVTGLGPAS